MDSTTETFLWLILACVLCQWCALILAVVVLFVWTEALVIQWFVHGFAVGFKKLAAWITGWRL